MVTEKDIIREIAQEKGYNEQDVQYVFEAWLEHLRRIVEESPQCTVRIPRFGRFYFSYVKMKRGLHNERLRKFRDMKMKEIEQMGYNCRYFPHIHNIPVILAHGVARKNRMPRFLNKDAKTEYFTPSDVVNNQVEYFFKEDIEFAGNNKLKQLFLRKDAEDFDIHNETTEDTNTETSE